MIVFFDVFGYFGFDFIYKKKMELLIVLCNLNYKFLMMLFFLLLKLVLYLLLIVFLII